MPVTNGSIGMFIFLPVCLYENGRGGAVPLGHDPDATALFSESTTRFLGEIEAEKQGAFEAALDPLPCALVGRVRSDDQFEIRSTGGQELARLSLTELRDAHRSFFQG